jgi:uncharacterized protein
MPVKNETRKTVIAAKSKIADSLLGRSVGLMFSKPTDAAMVLKFPRDTLINLHTYFVFFPIDIVFVNNKMRVVETVESMKPFKTYSTKRKSKFVIELPSGTVKKSKTKLKDRITFLKVTEKKLANGRRITVSKA